MWIKRHDTISSIKKPTVSQMKAWRKQYGVINARNTVTVVAPKRAWATRKNWAEGRGHRGGEYKPISCSSTGGRMACECAVLTQKDCTWGPTSRDGALAGFLLMIIWEMAHALELTARVRGPGCGQGAREDKNWAGRCGFLHFKFWSFVWVTNRICKFSIKGSALHCTPKATRWRPAH